ncbi:MAG: hypothetical protein ACYC46_05315 [Acidobacteriaceae bacterium]
MTQAFELVRAVIRKKRTADKTSQLLSVLRSVCMVLALMVAVPLVIAVSTQIWFRSAYTSGAFHYQGFADIYAHGIYRYRILGRDILLFLYKVASSHFHDVPFPMPRDPYGTLLFYGSYVVLNSACLFLTNFLLLLTLWDRDKGISDYRLIQYFFCMLLLAMSMVVVTPYDQLAYCFLLLTLLCIRIKRAWLRYLAIGALAVIGGLNRETQFLVTPTLLVLAIYADEKDYKRYFYGGLYHLAIFALVYVSLRIVIPGEAAISGGLTFGGKWAVESAITLGLLVMLGTILANMKCSNMRPALLLYLMSGPYVLTILVSGVLRELRLLIPILFCLFSLYAELDRFQFFRNMSSDQAHNNQVVLNL